MTTSHIHDDFDRIERSGSIAVRSISIAWKLRDFFRSLGNAAIARLFLVVTVPIFILLYTILWFCVWRLNHSRPFNGTLNAKNYKAFRLRYEKLSRLSDGLQLYESIDLSKRQWFVRPFLSLSVKTARILLRHKNEMAAVLKQLDEPFDTLPNGWQVFTTNERWASRPKPYEYLA